MDCIEDIILLNRSQCPIRRKLVKIKIWIELELTYRSFRHSWLLYRQGTSVLLTAFSPFSLLQSLLPVSIFVRVYLGGLSE